MLYVILPVHNRKNVTEKLIRSLKEQTYQDFTLVLVDDGSTDGTSEMVTGYFGNVVVIRGKGNWWWGGSLHQGYKWLTKNKVSAEANILILNDDVVFEKDFLQIGIEKINENPDALILSQDYDSVTGELLDSGSNVDWEHLIFSNAKSPEEINILSTRGLFFKMRVFYEIGGFHPTLIPHYQSDYEFTHRAFRKGFRMLTFPELKLKEDTKQTGIRVRATGFKGFLQSHFSKRSNYYQLSWFAFILFVCPWRWKFKNLYKVSITHRYIGIPILHYLHVLREKYFLFRISRNSIKKSATAFSEYQLVPNQQSSKKTGRIEYFYHFTIIRGVHFARFIGWASDPLDPKIPAKIILVVKDKSEVLGTLKHFKIKRPDIAIAQDSEKLKKSGFIGYINTGVIDHLNGIEFYAISANGKEIQQIEIDRIQQESL
ncbi:glycosyltransferase family 2 protein [Leptospira ognonensis]|uniref:Glycosyltransferase family 2 protein n=1 Tax=Leptospira ognonensis TaxID=2484945 RepID=A0A4R9JUM7_9LEPT|nr:glycosyltransferase family 2 protein [Leptospira ognonensis]TGL56533.1 glycosyltransferase family 2 protein [Leptospira ognonensis]